eukprot:708951_1
MAVQTMYHNQSVTLSTHPSLQTNQLTKSPISSINGQILQSYIEPTTRKNGNQFHHKFRQYPSISKSSLETNYISSQSGLHQATDKHFPNSAQQTPSLASSQQQQKPSIDNILEREIRRIVNDTLKNP